MVNVSSGWVSQAWSTCVEWVGDRRHGQRVSSGWVIAGMVNVSSGWVIAGMGLD